MEKIRLISIHRVIVVSALLRVNSQEYFGAFVEHAFPRGFMMDEGHLRKLNEIISQRIAPLTTGAVLYRIYRSDSKYYSTPNINDIITEDNFGSERITQIVVEASCGDQFHLELRFGSDGAKLSTHGNDRDFVFLLVSDLKQYINSEMRSPHLPSTWIKYALGILPIAFMLVELLLLNALRPTMPPDVTSSALQSTQVIDKLDYLVQADALGRSVPMPVWPFFAAMITASVFLVVQPMNFDPISKFLVPSNLFLFGRELDRYRKRVDSRKNFFWGVIVTFVVSLVTGLMVWYFTKST